jgi:hypothetical protein
MATLQYDFDSAIKFAGWAVAALTLLYHVHRSRISDKRIKRAEDKVREIESRGKAPYLIPFSEPFQQLYEDAEDGKTYVWSPTQGNVLCWFRKRVSEDIPDGNAVILALENQGEDVRRIRIETNLKGCELCQGRDPGSGQRRTFLKYQYESALQGTPAELKISFESSDGYKSTHTYKTVHGEFVFQRVDPP